MSLKVGVVGVCGRMGKEILNVLKNDTEAVISCGFDRNLSSDSPFLSCTFIADVFKNSDVVIDFSSPDSAIECFKCAEESGVPLVSGTTGIDESIRNYYCERASKSAAILWASNMSFGINMILYLLKNVSKNFGDDFDVEIFEMHHSEKVDAPSGTSVSIGQTIAEQRGVQFTGNCDRSGKREKGSIGMAISRGGGVFGDHSITFVSKDESITLSHRALNRTVFASGSVKAAKWISRVKPGIYSFIDVLGF